tara:strand:- start:1205 stop:1519 length:315 start_codon:yes stop_codon:yes gene_type:complete
MFIKFNTNRPYSKDGQTIVAHIFNKYTKNGGIEYATIFFYDYTRKIGGTMEFDLEIENFNEKEILFKYDHGDFDEDETPNAKNYFSKHLTLFPKLEIKMEFSQC